MFVDPCIIV